MTSDSAKPCQHPLTDSATMWLKNTLGQDGDGRVPCAVFMDSQAWDRTYRQHKDRLEKVAAQCPNVSFSIPTMPARTGEETVTDRWGCRWLYNEISSDGAVVGHPLASWDALHGYKCPDPATYFEWEKETERIAREKESGNIAWFGVEHGFYFLRLTYLRGFENMLMDVAGGSPQFADLLERVTVVWEEIGRRIAAAAPDFLYLGDDLGMQQSLPMSPKQWRQTIKPGLMRIIAQCKAAGTKVHMHTDGYIVDIIPDLAECGVDVLNPQDLVNGLDNLERVAKERVAMNLDIDRQKITPFGTPEQIRAHVGECVRRLGSPTGGLSLLYGVYTGVPIENIEAVFLAMQEHQGYWVR